MTWNWNGRLVSAGDMKVYTDDRIQVASLIMVDDDDDDENGDGCVLLSHGQPSLQAAIQNFDCVSTQPNINPPSILVCVWDLPKCDHRIIFHPNVSELNKTK